jgi:protein SMG7
MTEITSRTDEDVLRDAFRFLDTSTEDDDEIVWDPRYVLLCLPLQ